MKTALPPPASVEAEISALTALLQKTGQRLEALTAGEVDSVVDHTGRVFLLKGVQEQLRHAEDSRQAAILNALPANIALLDRRGVIVSVNEAWRRFGAGNACHCPGHEVGADYLEICDTAQGDFSTEAHEVASGIRAVLNGSAKSYSLEYSYDSPAGQRWFLMTATPLADQRLNGAAVMHLNITGRKRSEQELQAFGAAMDALSDAIYLVDRASMQIVHVNDTACRMMNKTRAELMALNPWGILAISRAELERTYDMLIASGVEAPPLEMLRPRAGGAQAWVELRRHALRSGDRWTIVTLVRDITERKRAEEKISRLNRVYAMLSGINSAIVRIRTRDALFRETCRIAVSDGGFVVARVIELDSGGKAGIAATSESDSRLFREIVENYNSDPAHSTSLLADALRSGQPTISNDVALDPRIPNRAALTREGNYALALFPIIVEQRVAGAVVLRSRDAGMFDAAEQQLLLEVVSNLSFALDHIEKEAKVQRLTRVYAVLSGINALIVRARDRDELFSEVCRIAVENGGFRSVWIGVIDSSAQRIVPVASAGADKGLLSAVKDLLSSSDGALQGNTLAAQAIRQKRAFISNDSQNDPAVLFGKTHADFDVRSMAMLPLIVAGEATAVLALYAGEIDFFSANEMNLLTELSDNIAFAIDHIHKEFARKEAEARVVRLNRVYAVLSGINTLIVRARDREELFKEACRIAHEEGGFRMSWIGILDRSAMKIVPVASAGMDEEVLNAIKERFSGSLSEGAALGASMAALAIRTKQAAVSNDTVRDPRIVFTKKYSGAGVRSMAMLPLIVADEPVGLLALYAGDVDFFHAEEMKLLTELAGDVAFAIDHIGKNERLDYLAYYDVLTGLANRSLFLERVAQYVRSAASGGHKLAVFLIDLERFKNINDSLGRPAGDVLLKQVATWLTHSTGDANLLARVDADHFALVLPEIRPDGSVPRLVDKIMAAFMEHSFTLDDAVLRIALKAGIALFPADGADADTLLRNAEAALKMAKSRGERYLFYEQTMNAASAGKLTLENQLRRALENSEFVLHYQPKVRLEDGKVTSAEALIRWNDPRTGLVLPGRFIPILEEIGLIHEVGRWALRQAIEDYLRWRNGGLPAVRIAVNVSPLQLRKRGFIDEIGLHIGIDSQAAAGLELEITESLIMADVKHSIATLTAIRAMGISVAIDDFGTGFSSLSYLARLPVDTLKIDRSFVTDMTAGPEGLALVSTIINLAHSLKLKVVAEGVETDQQSRLLRLLRCNEIQGFLFSEPVPAETFEKLFLAAPVDVQQA